MITLSKKLKKQAEDKKSGSNNSDSDSLIRRVSVRDKLLIKEVQEMELNLPLTCTLKFDDPHQLHSFELIICPDEGYWQDGKFRFRIYVTEEYNMVPPKVKCLTRLWHPNINEEGEICLSLLRENSIDGLGWAPTRRLKDIVWGLNSLFTDLLNFDDPLNIEAAEHYQRDKIKMRKDGKFFTFTRFLTAICKLPFAEMFGGDDVYNKSIMSTKLIVKIPKLRVYIEESFRAKVRDYVQKYAMR